MVCRTSVLCEQPGHGCRIAALHQIAPAWKAEQGSEAQRGRSREGLPLVDDQTIHRNDRAMSVGIFSGEAPIEVRNRSRKRHSSASAWR